MCGRCAGLSKKRSGVAANRHVCQYAGGGARMTSRRAKFQKTMTKNSTLFTSQKVHFLAYYFQKHLFKCKATSDLCSRHTGQCWAMRTLRQWLYYFVNMLMRCSAVEFVVVGHAVGTSALICVMWQIDRFYEIGCDLLIFELRSGWMTLEGFFRISLWVYWTQCCELKCLSFFI